MGSNGIVKLLKPAHHLDRGSVNVITVHIDEELSIQTAIAKEKQMSGYKFDLGGQQAIVTGASKGLGAAIAIALADCGARVLAVARSEEELRAMARRQPLIEPWVADIRAPSFASELAAREVDILINNAGMNRPLPMADVPVEVLDEMLSLNIRSAYLVAQAAVRSMLRRDKGGCIINVTSQMGHVGSPNRTVYCMTKHALEGLTKAMAVELAAERIRVNSVAPTFVETPMTERMLADPAFLSFVERMIPLGRIAQPGDVSAAVLYLCSPLAAMVTGSSLVIDGGWTAQ
ncbi:SDR family NAD(P)-dependent oxidoreductase [Novosphingobium sp.]|uniref:SDR family NAD(P)-dependent oxidoreductase n=1 Tax=Novosphingobium sp. TaxID=1874826 RepID=UPI0035B25300